MKELEEVSQRNVSEKVLLLLTQAGKKVAAIRNEINATQQDIAFYAGLDKSFISNLERGMIDGATLTTLVKISEVFQMEVWDLFKN